MRPARAHDPDTASVCFQPHAPCLDPLFVFGIPSVCFQPHATRAVRTRHRRGNQREQMAPVVLCAVSLAVAARRLQDASCPCLQSPPSGTGYPTFTLAGTTISYEYGELRVSPKSETQIVPVLVIVP